MNLSQKVLSRILEIEKEEIENLSYLSNEIAIQPSLLAHSQSKELIQFLFKNDRYGNTIFDRGWGNLIDKSSAIAHLLYNSNLVIDLKGNLKSNQDFIKNYGISVHQMAQLARASKISINILAYDSTKKNGFSPYLLFKSSDSSEEDAYCDLFLYKNGTRIYSLRRELFFDLKLKAKGHQGTDFFVEGLDVLGKIKSLTMTQQGELLSSNAFRDNANGDIDVLITSLARQYGYNRKMSLINLTDEDLIKINDFTANLLMDDDNESLVKFSYLLRGLKVLIASPLTASMGGTYNMSPNSITALIELQDRFDGYELPELKNLPDFEELRKNVITEEIKESALKTLAKRVAKSEDLAIPECLNQRQFENFISFITEQKDSVKNINLAVDKLSHNPYLTEKRLFLIEEYFERCSLISDDISFRKMVISDSLGGAVSGFTTGVMALAGIDPNTNLLYAALGGLGVTALSKAANANPTINNLINRVYGTKHQMVMDMVELIRLTNSKR